MNKTLNFDLIVVDPVLQSRAEITQEVIDEYAESMESGDEFPPISITFDGTNHYMTDGWHRYFAMKKLGVKTCKVVIKQGTFHDAFLASRGANTTHGLPRSQATKRKNVMDLLDDFEASGWSDRAIAKWTKVSHTLVASLRTTVPAEKKSISKDGNVFTRKTKPKPEKPTAVEVPKEEPVDPKLKEAIDYLTEENERLNARLAVDTMDATEEDKKRAEQLIAELRDEVKLLNIELAAVKKSRDQFQAENAQMKKQIIMLRKTIQKYEKE